MKNKKNVLVTGAAGFVGGQTVLKLHELGHQVFAVDQVPPPEHLRKFTKLFLQEDYANHYVCDLIDSKKIDAIIHTGGTSLVGPSVMDPDLYYRNNFIKTKTLLDAIRKSRHKPRMIFSSSSSVYGEVEKVPIEESKIPDPVSPYGESKRMVEQMLSAYRRAYGLDFVALRYFNVCGADPKARHGQAPNATHIIARILESIRDRREFTINGNDFPTPDGTCVRDHVHVDDVASLHALAMDPEFVSDFYNVGLRHGASNLEIVKLAEKVTGTPVNLRWGGRREGDPSILVGDNSRLLAQGWKPQFDLEDMVRHAWAWYNR